MELKQKQVIEAYQRIEAFLATHPAPSPATYAEPQRLLEAAVARLASHSSAQAVGTRLSQAERERQQVLMTQLRERHLRPIVAIARATMEELPGIEKALKMPVGNIGVLELVA